MNLNKLMGLGRHFVIPKYNEKKNLESRVGVRVRID